MKSWLLLYIVQIKDTSGSNAVRTNESIRLQNNNIVTSKIVLMRQ
jgi:hypothetical protein